MKYIKCDKCDCEEFIRTDRRLIVNIRESDTGGLIDEEIDTLVFPSYTYECSNCNKLIKGLNNP